jgi:hypothetical protein
MSGKIISWVWRSLAADLSLPHSLGINPITTKTVCIFYATQALHILRYRGCEFFTLPRPSLFYAVTKKETVKNDGLLSYCAIAPGLGTGKLEYLNV